MANPNATTISILKNTRLLLAVSKHTGQSYDGFLQELLTSTTVRLSPDTLARLERYRKSERDTVDDLIVCALNENAEFEKRVVKKDGE